ncbi:hypothetical protein [Sandaracinus amylolyticus]|uniref:hypothetical protein n=1 Tax=Sandaracinus amylolyticus TaxID=927083 RepID=UPI001F23154B|nr:hypothetical protein [Sandaracinus amylolyticus]UJR85297.1 Hypothetical protein I5071_73770 [Sandaracinus amylolyticus]
MLRLFVLCSLALAASLLGACDQGEPEGESSLDACSNGRDDDDDDLVDCSDPACRAYVFCLSNDAGADAGPVDAAPLPDGAVCVRPIDVVLTVDVSSSMGAPLAALRDASATLIERLQQLDPSARVSLVVFVDDALAIDECAPLDATALHDQLELWRVRSEDNRSPVSDTYNTDCPENSLDALMLATRGCPWRAGAARLVVHVTDDTFAERPTVLSGPFGGGIVVQSTYAEVGEAMEDAGVRMIALTRTGAGQSCGAGRSPDVGQGFQTPYRDALTLPELTGGVALLLPDFVAGNVDVVSAIVDRAQLACEP